MFLWSALDFASNEVSNSAVHKTSYFSRGRFIRPLFRWLAMVRLPARPAPPRLASQLSGYCDLTAGL